MIENLKRAGAFGYFALGLSIAALLIGLVVLIRAIISNHKLNKELNRILTDPTIHDNDYLSENGCGKVVKVDENGKPITGCGSLYEDQVRDLNNTINAARYYKFNSDKQEWYKEPFKVGQTVWYIADSGDRICTFTIDRIEVFSHVYSGLKTYVYFDKSGYQKLDKDLFGNFWQAEPALDERLRNE